MFWLKANVAAHELKNIRKDEWKLKTSHIWLYCVRLQMYHPKTAIKNVCPRCAQTTNLELEHQPTQEADNAITSHCWGQRDNVRHLSLSLSLLSHRICMKMEELWVMDSPQMWEVCMFSCFNPLIAHSLLAKAGRLDVTPKYMCWIIGSQL